MGILISRATGWEEELPPGPHQVLEISVSGTESWFLLFLASILYVWEQVLEINVV